MSHSNDPTGLMPHRDRLISVGIDIGTTSTHLVFSELTLANSAASTQIPSLTIRERQVIFESAIHFTPLAGDGSIDGAGVKRILNDEFKNAAMQSSDIDCGAVIITGETARLRNAPGVLQEISELAGDFVSASAGPDLESVLAARGAGAVQHSLETGRTICNIDIGGGTTNIAIFKGGELLATACLRIGGRCFQFTADGELLARSASGELLQSTAPSANYPISIADWEELAHFAAAQVFNFICGDPFDLADLLMTKPIEPGESIDEFWFSGGVAELMRLPETERFAYGDFGWFLARGFEKSIGTRQVNAVLSKNPIRATVLGAGSYSMQLSGNTVSAEASSLPIKGVPLVRPFAQIPAGPLDSKLIERKLKTAVSIFDRGTTVAIVVDGTDRLRYAALKDWAAALSGALVGCALAQPYILITSGDTAMALGQLMKGHLRGEKLIVLDGLDLTIADYIDIGKPIGVGSTIPVTLKSLVFASES